MKIDDELIGTNRRYRLITLKLINRPGLGWGNFAVAKTKWLERACFESNRAEFGHFFN